MTEWEVLATRMAGGHGVLQYFDASQSPEGAHCRTIAP